MITIEKMRRAFSNGSEYVRDCELIKDVILRRLGLWISTGEANRVWRWNSENACAGWLIVTENDEDEIVRVFEAFVEKFGGDE
jgi:hypothetical protein